jgi:hypothetical protein
MPTGEEFERGLAGGREKNVASARREVREVSAGGEACFVLAS